MTWATIEGPLRAGWLGALVALAAVWLVLWTRKAWRSWDERTISVLLTVDVSRFVEACRAAAAAMERMGVAARAATEEEHRAMRWRAR